MSKNALIVLSVLEHKIPVSQVAKEYGVSRTWVSRLPKRHRLIGVEAFKPGSRVHHSDPNAVADGFHEQIVGLDAGASSIRYRLIAINGQSPAISIIWQSLRHQGLVEYTPQKKQSATCSALKRPNRMKPGNQISPMFVSVITKTFWC
jgi:hypothetical protein